MNTSLPSATRQHTPALDVRAEIREFVAALPVVIFANAIRDALQRPQHPARRATVQRAVAR